MPTARAILHLWEDRLICNLSACKKLFPTLTLEIVEIDREMLTSVGDKKIGSRGQRARRAIASTETNLSH